MTLSTMTGPTLVDVHLQFLRALPAMERVRFQLYRFPKHFRSEAARRRAFGLLACLAAS